MILRPDQLPRDVLGRVLALGVRRIVVLVEAAIQIISLTDVESAVRILENIHVERQTPRVGLEPTT